MAKKTDALAKTSPIGGAAAAVGVVALVEPAVPFLIEQIEKFTIIPPLYGKDLHIPVEQAEERLKQNGFVCNPSKLCLSDADPKYKDCIDRQIVKTIPRKHAVIPKTNKIITLIYITQEVIDESKRLFEEEQARKAAEEERKKNRLERKEKKQERRNSKESKLKTIFGKKENDNEQRE